VQPTHTRHAANPRFGCAFGGHGGSNGGARGGSHSGGHLGWGRYHTHRRRSDPQSLASERVRRIHLRHPCAVRFTAEDVGYTFNQIVLKPDAGANGRGNFAAVKDVQVVDPKTVTFNLSRPFAALPSYVAYNAGILPKHVFEGAGDPWSLTSFNKATPVTTGPFKVENFTSGQSVTLVRNDAYYAGKRTSTASSSRLLRTRTPRSPRR
jgi:hypothetical protein